MLLQWGRNFIVAEMTDEVLLGWLMKEPLQWGRNFIVAEIALLKSHVGDLAVASMGPQLYRCGNEPHGRGRRTLSRRFNGAATLSLRKLRGWQAVFVAPSRLQWGRNFIVAEIRFPTVGGYTVPPGFNGAATLSLRKSAVVYTLCQLRQRFNGAATLSLRKFAVFSLHHDLPVCFNGAATLSLRKFENVQGGGEAIF